MRIITGVSKLVTEFSLTAEGYYSFIENRYIYQYKDHLGNVRVSFARDSAGALEVTDKNDYYPFGMNHLNPDTGAYFGQSSYKNYKYNGKELQETGMYDYGARMYMPDIGRWGVPDILAETSRKWSPYTYVYDNPLRFIDPTGMYGEEPRKGDPDKIYDNGTIQEVVLTKVTPVKGQMAGISSGMPPNCLICNASSSFSINLPPLPQSITYRPVLNNGAAYMMGGDMLGVSDLAGLFFSRWYEDLEPDEQKGALFLGGIALILTHNTKIAGMEAGAILAAEKAEAKGVFTVTKDGVVLPKDVKIPSNLVENPFRTSSYGEIQNGKFVEKLRIDPATPAGMKGPNVSHFHINGS